MAMIEITGPDAGPGLRAYAEAIERIFSSASQHLVDQSVLMEAVRGLNIAARAGDQVNRIEGCELKNYGVDGDG